MKPLFAIVFLLLRLHAQAQVCVTAPSGIVSWWPGDVNENDIVSGVDPENVNAVSLTNGLVGDGFTFGYDGYLEFAATPTLANQHFTWLAWVKPEGPGPNNDAAGSVIVAQSVNGFYNNVSLQWSALNSNFLYIFGGDNTELITSPSSYPAGSYYLVAGTYDGSTFRLFINGNAEGTYSESKTVTYSSNPWTIGSAEPDFIQEGYARTWNGVIDEVQAYSTALSQSQIQAIYKAGSGGVCKGLTSTPAQLTFPTVALGASSTPQTVTVTNSFPRPVIVYSIAASAQFNQNNSCPVSPATLASGAACTVNVSFAPTAEGPQTGQLTLTTSAPAANLIVDLTGAGTALRMAPADGLEFGTRTLGVPTPPKNVTVKNVGSSTVRFAANGISIGGADPSNFIISGSTCGSTLGVGAACTIGIEFESATVGTSRAALELRDNAGASPQTLKLTGQAN